MGSRPQYKVGDYVRGPVAVNAHIEQRTGKVMKVEDVSLDSRVRVWYYTVLYPGGVIRSYYGGLTRASALDIIASI